jgi:hypothetical protein
MKLKFPSTDRILGISAIMISLATFAIYAIQTNLMQKQQKVSVWPNLTMEIGLWYSEKEPYFNCQIKNKGIGPAVIEEVNIIYKGKKYDCLEDIDDAEMKNLNITYSCMSRGEVIPAGGFFFVVGLVKGATVEDVKKLGKFFKQDVQYEIIYKSVYDEYWKILGEKRAIKLKDYQPKEED